MAVDPDLHAFVDGCLDSQRRVDVLKRVARSPDDRARVALWQDQNDSLRSAFAGIEDEAVPQSLDLAAPNRSSGLSFDGTALGSTQLPDAAPRSHLLVSGFVAGVVLCAGIILALLIARENSTRTEPVDLLTTTGGGSPADDQLPSGSAGGRWTPNRGAGNAGEIALGDLAGTRASVGAFSTLPIPLAIPDLAGQGLEFVGATRESAGVLILRYAGASGERVVVAMSPDEAGVPSTGIEAGSGVATGEAPMGSVLTWHADHMGVAVAGVLPSAALRAVATSLRTQIAAQPMHGRVR